MEREEGRGVGMEKIIVYLFRQKSSSFPSFVVDVVAVLILCSSFL